MRLSRQTTWLISGLGTAALSLLGGCQSRGTVELLEARLRDQEDVNDRLRRQVERQHQELVAARRLNESLNQKISQTGVELPPAEELERQHSVMTLKVNSLLTGGVDRDGQPGDDQLTVVVVPLDHLGKPVQVPGNLQCVLIDTAQPEGQQRLGLWSFDESDLADSWTNSLGTVGYRVELPWQQIPTSTQLELRLRLTSAHGDQLEAATNVKVNPPE